MGITKANTTRDQFRPMFFPKSRAEEIWIQVVTAVAQGYAQGPGYENENGRVFPSLSSFVSNHTVRVADDVLRAWEARILRPEDIKPVIPNPEKGA